MSWLISLVLAGVVFTADSTVPVQRNNFTSGDTTTKVIRLDETERFDQTYPLNSNGRVSVSNVNGSITIDTWDRNEVRLEAVKTADDKDRLSEVEIKIDARREYLSVETDYGSWKRDGNRGWRNNGKLTVDYKLTVPRNAILDEIETVNGSVSIANTSNLTKASAVNGEVTAVNLRGAAELSTVNGKIEVGFDQLQSTSKINLDTVNGTVNLTIPSDANATVKADTVNGSITNDFGLPVRKGKYVGRDLYGRIGSGEVQIRLNSVNGALNVRSKGGKGVNPATNLLPPADKEDDDWDGDNDGSGNGSGDGDNPVDVAKLNKEINKNVQKAQKETAAALQRSQKDMERAQKELMKIQVQPEIKINQAEIQMRIDEGLRMARLADVNFNAAPVIEKKSDIFNVKGVPTVTVDAPNCAVSVHGWDKGEVQYSITRISKNRNQKQLSYTADHSESEVKITVGSAKDSKYRELYRNGEQIRVEVFVPKKSNLRIHTNREIRLENVSGDIDLTGGDESVNIRDVDGKLRVATAGGKVRVIGFKGEIDSKTAVGDMSLEGEFDKITATTGDGNIVVTLPDDVSAVIKANTEDVNLDGIKPSRIKTVDISEDAAMWRIGSGSATYNFNVVGGQVFIRSMNELKASL